MSSFWSLSIFEAHSYSHNLAGGDYCITWTKFQHGHDGNDNKNNCDNRIIAATFEWMLEFSTRQQMWLLGTPSVSLVALPDYTNGHEKGYQNVRVRHGKPLTSGNTARLLLQVYRASAAGRPELCECPQMEQPKMTISRVGERMLKKENQDKMLTDNMTLPWEHRLWQTVPFTKSHSIHSHQCVRRRVSALTVWTHVNTLQYFRMKGLGLASSLSLTPSRKYLHQESN